MMRPLAVAKRALCLGSVVVLAVVILRAAFPPNFQQEVPACKASELDFLKADSERISRFQSLVRIPTISKAPRDYDREQLLRLHQQIRQNYPLVFSAPTIDVEIVANYSILLTWRGTDPSLKAALLASHLDVVPIENATRWEHPPFSAQLDSGFIYGRGTLDDKSGVFAILEVMEHLLHTRGTQYRPRRTFIVAFGHDEEVTGLDGAGQVGKRLQERGERIEFLIDEGLPISVDLIPMVQRPVALVGVAEKGYLDAELSVAIDLEAAGHSSRPPQSQAIVILSDAISRLHRHQLPTRLSDGVEDMFEHVAPFMPFVARIFLCNLWLFRPVVEYALSLTPNTNSLVRTTMAVTMISGGFKANALPTTATANVNFRIGLEDTVESVLEHVQRVVADERVKVTAKVGVQPQKASSCSSFGFSVVETSLRQIYPELIVAPSVMVAGTDTEHYKHLTKDIYRLLPIRMTSRDIARIHGDDERISIEEFERVLNFYQHVFENADRATATSQPHHGSEL